MKLFALFILLFLQFNCGQLALQQRDRLSNLAISSQINGKDTEKDEDDCVKTDFNFFMVQDYLAWDSQRHLLIFLDENAFSEKNLKELFVQLSKKYAESDELIIVVETNWKRLPKLNDCLPPGGQSEGSNGSNTNDFHRAIFYREKSSEYFIYNPVLKTSDYTKVIVKRNKSN